MQGEKFKRQYERTRTYIDQLDQLDPKLVLNTLYNVYPIAFDKAEIRDKVIGLYANHGRELDFYGINLARLYGRSPALKVALCCMPKSGSTFIQKSLRTLPKPGFEIAYLHAPYMNADFVGAHSKEHEIDELALLALELRGKNYVSQMHTKWSEYTEACFRSHDIKPIVTFRNIFDCIVSLDEMLKSGDALGFPMVRVPKNYPLMADAERLSFLCCYAGPWYIDYVVSWSRVTMPILRLDYDADIRNFGPATASKIRNYLGIDWADETAFNAAFALTEEHKSNVRLNKGISGRGVAIPDAARDQLRLLASVYQSEVNFESLLD